MECQSKMISLNKLGFNFSNFRHHTYIAIAFALDFTGDNSPLYLQIMNVAELQSPRNRSHLPSEFDNLNQVGVISGPYSIVDDLEQRSNFVPHRHQLARTESSEFFCNVISQ
jgi:hypothetical protein